MNFLAENWGTIVTGFAVAVVVFFVFRKLIKDAIKGKSFCGCGCSSCGCGCGHTEKTSCSATMEVIEKQ